MYLFAGKQAQIIKCAQSVGYKRTDGRHVAVITRKNGARDGGGVPDGKTCPDTRANNNTLPQAVERRDGVREKQPFHSPLSSLKMWKRRCLFLFLFIMFCSLCVCQHLTGAGLQNVHDNWATQPRFVSTLAASVTTFLLICQGYKCLLVS